MYLLTNHDKWLIGQIHEYLEHNCDLTIKNFCDVYERLETAYNHAKDEERKLIFDQANGD